MSRWLEISANRRVLAYILFSTVVLGAMFVLGIQPARQQIAQAEKEALRMEARIEEQKIFHPLYQSLKLKEKNRIGLEFIMSGMRLEREPYLNIENAPEVLFSMAQLAGMQTASFYPTPGSMVLGSERLLVQGALGGRYPAFRNFLMNLVAFPAFHSFEILEVQSGTAFPEYTLQIWFSIE